MTCSSLAATLALAMMLVTVTHLSSADMHGHIVGDPGPRGRPATPARPGAAFAPSLLPCLRNDGKGPATARAWCARGGGMHRPVRSLVDDDVGAWPRTNAQAGSCGGLYMLARNGASPADDARRSRSSAGAEDSRLTGIVQGGGVDGNAGPVRECERACILCPQTIP